MSSVRLIGGKLYVFGGNDRSGSAYGRALFAVVRDLRYILAAY